MPKFDEPQFGQRAGPRLRDLLDACPGVTLLVTSRISLRLSGEREFPVAPLPLSTSTTVEDTGLSGAVRLFVERAQAIKPDFSLTAETLPAMFLNYYILASHS